MNNQARHSVGYAKLLARDVVKACDKYIEVFDKNKKERLEKLVQKHYEKLVRRNQKKILFKKQQITREDAIKAADETHEYTFAKIEGLYWKKKVVELKTMASVVSESDRVYVDSEIIQEISKYL